MGNYKVTNLKQADDAAEGHDGMELRFGRKHLESEHLGVTYVRYEPNFHNSSGHSHKEQEEAYVVISGSGKVRVDDDVIELGLWDVVRVSPAGIRAFEAGPDGLELIAVGGPKPEGGDGVLAKDWWPQ